MRTARAGIRRAVLLAFHYEKTMLAGIAAIKRPDETYKRRIFSSSNTDVPIKNYELELGYVMTHEDFRGRGICSSLIKHLLEGVQSNIYASTRAGNAPMLRILEKHGFKMTGKPYESKREGSDYFIQLLVLDPAVANLPF